MSLRGEWQARALCAGTKTELWFLPEPPPWLKGWCRRCPVQRECLTETLEIERPGALRVVDMPIFKRVLYHHDGLHRTTCNSTKCQGCVRVRKDWYERKRFSASFTPPFGIFGGFTPDERHARFVRHACETQDCDEPGGCRPIRDRVELLLGPDEQEDTA